MFILWRSANRGRKMSQYSNISNQCVLIVYMGVDGEDCVCCNEDNKNDAIQKIMSSFDGGYQITGVSLKPLPLKDPAKKCKRHALNYDAMTVAMKNMF